jgi:hypothetical protein
MAIRYATNAQGGFTAGDTFTKNTAYAYPSSTHAVAAKHDPEKVAAEMVRSANYLNPLCPADIVNAANERNWKRINRYRYA